MPDDFAARTAAADALLRSGYDPERENGAAVRKTTGGVDVDWNF